MNDISEKSQTGMIGLIRVVLTTSGPVALLAIGLAVFQGYYIWEKLGRIEANQVHIMSSMSNAEKNMNIFVALHTELERQRLDLVKQQVRILQTICRNTTDPGRPLAACFGEIEVK